MSATDEFAAPEAKSSIKIAENAKREPIVTVTVREGTDDDELERIRTLAVSAYRATRGDVG